MSTREMRKGAIINHAILSWCRLLCRFTLDFI